MNSLTLFSFILVIVLTSQIHGIPLGGGDLTSALSGATGSTSAASTSTASTSTASTSTQPQQFPATKTSTTQTYNPNTRRYRTNNRYSVDGQTRDREVIGINLEALAGVLKG